MTYTIMQCWTMHITQARGLCLYRCVTCSSQRKGAGFVFSLFGSFRNSLQTGLSNVLTFIYGWERKTLAQRTCQSPSLWTYLVGNSLTVFWTYCQFENGYCLSKLKRNIHVSNCFLVISNCDFLLRLLSDWMRRFSLKLSTDALWRKRTGFPTRLRYKHATALTNHDGCSPVGNRRSSTRKRLRVIRNDFHGVAVTYRRFCFTVSWRIWEIPKTTYRPDVYPSFISGIQSVLR